MPRHVVSPAPAHSARLFLPAHRSLQGKPLPRPTAGAVLNAVLCCSALCVVLAGRHAGACQRRAATGRQLQAAAPWVNSTRRSRRRQHPSSRLRQTKKMRGAPALPCQGAPRSALCNTRPRASPRPAPPAGVSGRPAPAPESMISSWEHDGPWHLVPGQNQGAPQALAPHQGCSSQGKIREQAVISGNAGAAAAHVFCSGWGGGGGEVGGEGGAVLSAL